MVRVNDVIVVMQLYNLGLLELTEVTRFMLKCLPENDNLVLLLH